MVEKDMIKTLLNRLSLYHNERILKMEIRNILEITPEIKDEAIKLLTSAKRLRELLGDRRFDLSFYTHPDGKITIIDRHEYSRDGLGTDLGFFTHHIYASGESDIDFVAENSAEAQEFDRQFNECLWGVNNELDG